MLEQLWSCFLFVVMMLDINIARKKAAYIKYLPLGLGVFIIFNVLIIYFFVNTFENINYNAVNNINIISESNTENLVIYFLQNIYLNSKLQD